MVQAFFTGANGLRAQQYNIDVIANNVANIDTFGYKQSRLDFKDALYNRMINPVDNGAHQNLQHGTGVLALQNNRIFHQGAAITTGRTLDFMLEGDGFFVVEDYDGDLLFTRGGSFDLSVEPDGAYLVTPDGRYVLDQNYERIVFTDANGGPLMITDNPGLLDVAPDGSIYVDGADTGVKMGVAAFINPVGLEVAGDNFFRVSENSGEPEELFGANVVHRTLEASNVDYANEMTRLIRAQRAYQMASRCINTADQMAGLANTVRG